MILRISLAEEREYASWVQGQMPGIDPLANGDPPYF
jgi:hypothetical protein